MEKLKSGVISTKALLCQLLLFKWWFLSSCFNSLKKRISFGDTCTLSLTKQIPRIRYITLNETNLILSVFPNWHRKSVEWLKRGGYLSYVFWHRIHNGLCFLFAIVPVLWNLDCFIELGHPWTVTNMKSCIGKDITFWQFSLTACKSMKKFS